MNFSQRGHPIVWKILPVFNALRGRATSAAWAVIVPFCFDTLRAVASGAAPAPQFVVCNVVNTLAGIWHTMKPPAQGPGGAAAATPATALQQAAAAAATGGAEGAANPQSPDIEEDFRVLASELGADGADPPADPCGPPARTPRLARHAAVAGISIFFPRSPQCFCALRPPSARRRWRRCRT